MHIKVDLLNQFLPPRAQRFHNILIAVISGLTYALLIWATGRLTLQVLSTGQESNMIGLPMVYVYGAMPVGFALGALLQFFGTRPDDAAETPPPSGTS